jgi:hypothetical protein
MNLTKSFEKGEKANFYIRSNNVNGNRKIASVFLVREISVLHSYKTEKKKNRFPLKCQLYGVSGEVLVGTVACSPPKQDLKRRTDLVLSYCILLFFRPQEILCSYSAQNNFEYSCKLWFVASIVWTAYPKEIAFSNMRIYLCSLGVSVAKELLNIPNIRSIL